MTPPRTGPATAAARPPRPTPEQLDAGAEPPAASDRAVLRGGGVAIALFALAVLVAHLPGVDVHAGAAAPLSAAWAPRVGWGTVPALLLLCWAASAHPWSAAQRLGWGQLLSAVWGLSLLWMLSLALVDGVDGVGAVLDHDTEYLATARGVDDITGLLRSFVERIPLAAEHNWPVHVAGHPPGALLFFVLLVRLGLGSGLAAGLVVAAVAATVPVAVAVTCRALGRVAQVRSALPFVVMGPFAVWQAVSADAVFAAVAAWTVALAAIAGASRTRPRAVAWAAAAGVGLGVCAMLSYGLPLVALVALAALVGTRGWDRDVVRLPAVLAVGAVVVVGGFGLAGFSYWDAYAVLHQRYWDGLASARPSWYWLWANPAVLAICVGPVLFGALTASGRRLLGAVARPSRDPLLALVVGALVAVGLADLSLMSKAEVERIWLPFVPWLALSAVVVPARCHRLALVGQAGVGLLVQSLLVTPW